VIPYFTRATTACPNPPADWDPNEGECSPLPIHRQGQRMISVWKPSAEELALLNAGGGVELTVLGVQHPVVSLGAVPAEELLVSI